MRTINFKIKEKDDSKQIRDFLSNFGVSSALLTTLKCSENGILLNGVFAKTIEKLHTDDTLTINIEDSGVAPKASNRKVHILYNDDDIIVADKPPFMPVHQSRNHIGDTLSNAVAPFLDGSFRSVYRLDRDTSGLVVIAKHTLSASKLAGKCDKTYYAICNGTTNFNGTINLPIARENESIIKRCVSPFGEKAITHYTSLFYKNNKTLVKINLETGRTHQIRVHFSHCSKALVGDTLYGKGDKYIMRQALHCGEVAFKHPVTNEQMHFILPPPPDFFNCLRGE